MSDRRYRYRHGNAGPVYVGLELCACCGARLHRTTCLICSGRGAVPAEIPPNVAEDDPLLPASLTCYSCLGRGEFLDCPRCGPQDGRSAK